MSNEEFLIEHPSLSLEQIVKIETEGLKKLHEITFSCPSLVWVRDEGNMAIMRATQWVDVYITHVRNGEVKSTAIISMRPGDTVNIMHNTDPLNYDGYAC